MLRQPARIGAVAPSSRELSQILASVVPDTGRPTVVELGAGTGAVSAAIRQRLPAEGRHIAVEIDRELANYLRERHPGMQVLVGDAAELHALVRATETERIDAVVSGLPWALFDEAQQRQVLLQVCRTLAPGANFSTFGYRHTMAMSAARRFRALLHNHFDEVVVTQTVWRNLPPALVYICRNPVSDPRTARMPAYDLIRRVADGRTSQASLVSCA
jgi:phospholipid N-methyltransferase